MLSRAYLLIALSGVTAFSQSHPPPPRPAELGQEKQNNAPKVQGDNNAIPRENANSSSFEGQSKVAPNTRESRTEQTKQPSSADWWTARFTAALVFVGFIQLYIYWRQTRYMGKGLRLTRRSADAAKAAADVARDTLAEIRNSAKDNRKLARAAIRQAEAMRVLADSSKESAAISRQQTGGQFAAMGNRRCIEGGSADIYSDRGPT